MSETAPSKVDLPSPPAVSVIVPTYQRREMVGRAIASALAQTFTDFELIVVDDGSTDGTESAVQNLDQRIRYVRQENRGVSAARNTGIRLARGPIVALLDSDDCWLPRHLEIVTALLARYPNAVLCSTSPRVEVGGRQPIEQAELIDALPTLFVENIVGVPASVAVRRDALLAVDGYDERLLVMEGWDLWLRLAALGPFALLQHQTVVVHATAGSLTERAARNGEYLRAIEIVSTRLQELDAMIERRPDRESLRRRAAGLTAYLQALSAIANDRPDVARAKLIDACSGLPELSTEPQLVANRLALMRFGPEARLGSYGDAAELWPSTRADTAMYLRFHALVLALRLGRFADAKRLITGCPLGALPGFAIRRASLFARLLRRTLQKLLHHGKEA
jgi:glycosyltransferase involved in cell wall biosynthesis